MKSSVLATLTGLGLLGFGVGCVGLRPSDDPTRFYVLQPAVKASAPAAHPETTEAVLYLPRVQTAAWMDEPGIAHRRGANQVWFAQYHQWAEPVYEGVSRLLRERLGDLLGHARVSAAGQRRPLGSQAEVQVNLLRFELHEETEALLLACWRIVDVRTGGTLHAAESEVRRSFAADPRDYSSAVAALSETVCALAAEIAASVSQLGDGGTGSAGKRTEAR